MNRHKLVNRIAGRLKTGFEVLNRASVRGLNYKMSRNEAKERRLELIRLNGRQYVDRKMMNRIKTNCKKRFGDSSYWPWLALYTEMRGEFFEEWIPVDYYRFKLLPAWNQLSEVSQHKSYDYRLFGDFAVRPVLIVLKGAYYDSDFQPVKPKRVRELLAGAGQEVVVKADGENSGKGTVFVKTSQFRPGMLDIRSNYVVQPVVKQHSDLARLSENSVNSIRITTFLTEDNRVRLLHANQKFGRGTSRVDNLGTGGLFVRLDEEGRVITGAMGDYGRYSEEVHPVGGFQYKGTVIPGFRDALEKCRLAHRSFPYTRVVGWDVAIDYTGSPKLLEWNARRPGIWVDEALFGPLWEKRDILL